MKKREFVILVLFCIYLSGCCSLPTRADYSQLYSITKETKKIKGTFGKKIILIKDFREIERYDEDIDALKKEVEKYIAIHPDLSEVTKNNLKDLKVTAGETKEEVRLLLGNPDKIIPAGNNIYDAGQIWIYKINKLNAFTIVFIPVFFSHEGYYLYFKDDVLVTIERHYLKQTFESRGIGLRERQQKTE